MIRTGRGQQRQPQCLTAGAWWPRAQYCLYRPRPGENATADTPVCPNIAQVARQHAEWLTSAGFDYVLVDFSNWPTTDGNCQPDCGPIGTTTVPSNDVEVLRPLEVLAEEWLALRAQVGVDVKVIITLPCIFCRENH